MLSAAAGNGPHRLIILSNYGVADSRRRTAYVAASWLLERAVLRDKEQMESLVRDSDAEWTVIRAPVLTNGSRTGDYRTGTDLRLSLTAKVSRADLAAFMLTELREKATRAEQWSSPRERSRRHQRSNPSVAPMFDPVQ